MVFAKRWAAAWNSRDIESILMHYAPDIVFRSRKALDLVGTGEVVGLQALRAYWTLALSRQPDLHFEVTEVFAGHDTVVITYRNHKGILAAETLQFRENGLVDRASACHAPLKEET